MMPVEMTLSTVSSSGSYHSGRIDLTVVDEDDEPDPGSEPSWDEAWVSTVLILIGAAALVVAVCLV